MTDQTTTAPSGASAHREAAVELEDILGKLNSDGTLDPSLFEIVLSGREVTRRYRGHTRTLRLASSALRDHQRRIDLTRSALAEQGPTDVSTAQIEALSRLVADITAAPVQIIDGHEQPLDLSGITSSALAAVLRAGLASVIGNPFAEDQPTEAAEPEQQRHSDGSAYKRFTVVVPPYATVSSLHDAIARTHPFTHESIDVRAYEAPAPSPSPWQSELELDVDTLENPVQHAVATVIHNGWQELSRFALVRAITAAALDAASDVVRKEIRNPRVSPLVVLDRTELDAEQVVEVMHRYRRTVADDAADELRILGRTDSAGR